MPGKLSYTHYGYYSLMIQTNIIHLTTEEGVTTYNITARIKEIVAQSEIKGGSVLVFTKHTTTAVRINEHEERLLEDIKIFLEKVAPQDAHYLHDDIQLRDCPPDERINAHAHLKALCLNASETIPILDGELALGKWQSILFFEFDGSREREIIVQVAGE